MEKRPCLYKTVSVVLGREVTSDWTPGTWHYWSTDHVEFESGPGHYPVAIVEGMGGLTHVVYARHVQFTDVIETKANDETEKYTDG